MTNTEAGEGKKYFIWKLEGHIKFIELHQDGALSILMEGIQVKENWYDWEGLDDETLSALCARAESIAFEIEDSITEEKKYLIEQCLGHLESIRTHQGVVCEFDFDSLSVDALASLCANLERRATRLVEEEIQASQKK